MKKVKKKGRTFKCSYYINGFHPKKKCFKKNMDIIYQLLEKHNIEVPNELEKPAKSLEQCHSGRSQGSMNYSLSTRVKSFPHIYDIYLFSDI